MSEYVTTRRAALYLRVSTDQQSVESQRRELEAAAAHRGWELVAVYEDAGISGAKGREKRPGLDRMLKDATRRKFDVVMTWAVDRLGRSLVDLIGGLHDLHAARVDLFIHQQAVDTTTPAGRALFQMMGVFAEFERSMIQARVRAGVARAQAEQRAGVVRRKADGTRKKAIGRPMVGAGVEQRIREQLQSGTGILKVARLVGVGSGTVQRVRREMAGN